MELPEEILMQILSRFPVKYLLQFKTVCKLWYSIINSKQFVKKHLNHAQSTHYNEHKHLLGIYIPSRKSKHCFLYKELSDGSLLARDCDVPHLVNEVWNYCNGLICFDTLGNGILVWNPSLPMECKIIPIDNSKLYGFWVGMGYDSTTDNYKIVRVPKSKKTTEDRSFRERYFFVEVFSLKSSSWSKREISKNFTYRIKEKDSVYTRNRIHWIGMHSSDGDKMTKFIVYFDMVKERLDHVNLPSKLSIVPFCSRRQDQCWSQFWVEMFDYKDSLAILDQDALWVLVDYNGMKSSWNKIFKHSKMFKSVDRKSNLCCYGCLTGDGKIVIHPERHSPIAYDPKDGSIKDVVIPDDDIIYEKLFIYRQDCGSN